MMFTAPQLGIVRENLLASIVVGRDVISDLDALCHVTNSHSATATHWTGTHLEHVGTARAIDACNAMGKNGVPRFSPGCLILPGNDVGFYTERRRSSELFSNHFFREFLLPGGFTHRACLHLRGAADISGVYFALWRDGKAGAFEADEITVLQTIAHDLRIVSILQARAAEAHVRRQADPFDARGDAVFSIDASRSFKPLNEAAERAAKGPHLRLQRGLLKFANPVLNEQCERLVRNALSSSRRAGALDVDRGRIVFSVLPVTGDARDVVHKYPAIAVLTDLNARPPAPDRTTNLISQAFGLTAREGEVVALIRQGMLASSIASRLQISEGTARNFIKKALAKTRTHSLSEMCALLSRFGP